MNVVSIYRADAWSHEVQDMNQQEKTANATAPVQEELAISTADEDKTDDDKTDIDDNGPVEDDGRTDLDDIIARKNEGEMADGSCLKRKAEALKKLTEGHGSKLSEGAPEIPFFIRKTRRRDGRSRTHSVYLY